MFFCISKNRAAKWDCACGCDRANIAERLQVFLLATKPSDYEAITKTLLASLF